MSRLLLRSINKQDLTVSSVAMRQGL